MPEIVHTAHDMISGMTPVMRPDLYIFATMTDPDLITELLPKAISTFKEDEGVSMLVPLDLAKKSKLAVDHPMHCITLNVYSSLEGVGLTAAVASALGENGIPCNMVAAFHHDHVFVPSEMGERAMEVLMTLQSQSAQEIADKS